MRSLSAHELLHIWEWGQTQHPIDRALSLLAVACPELTPEQLAQLSIGQRDAQLLTLREGLFGSQLTSLITCPQCGERLEIQLEAQDLRVAAEAISPAILTTHVEDCTVEFRLPNSYDLAAIARYADPQQAQQSLLERCILQVSDNLEGISTGELPANLADAIAAQMAQADPQADMQLANECPICQCQWQTTFDILAFLWSEINTWAQRLLGEVHLLASVYHWHEADILAMSPNRRALYLEMIGG